MIFLESSHDHAQVEFFVEFAPGPEEEPPPPPLPLEPAPTELNAYEASRQVTQSP